MGKDLKTFQLHNTLAVTDLPSQASPLRPDMGHPFPCLPWQKSHVLHVSTHIWYKLHCDVKQLPFPDNKHLVFFFFHLPSHPSGSYWVLDVLLKTCWNGLYFDSSGAPALRAVILSYSNEPSNTLMYKVHVFHHISFLISEERCTNHILLIQLILFSNSIFIHVYATFQQETPNI